MQQPQTNNRSQEELIRVASIIFPAPPNKYDYSLLQAIQYAQIEQSNKVPFYLLQNEDKTINNYILYFHGNGEDLQSSFYMMKSCVQQLKAHFILVEYPGYGVYNNTITTTEQIQMDALIVYDYVKQKYSVNDNQIYVFGRSIGTGPAIYIGAHRNCAGLIMFCAYTTLLKLVQQIIPKKAIYLQNENNLNNEENSQKLQCKCLFIQGRLDTLTPLQPIELLYNNLPAHIKDKSYLQIQEQMTHNFFSIQTDIIDQIIKFYPELKMNNPISVNEGFN
ncbi:unnamed protein product [Paramecium sonneborni]|uniref:Serine aminopeptidase S33 domain-containing protein n=1 Tax=Paramecium sonneborni TaxID=65129 RepID=A0A8S1MCB9_9CILI|nr:unnamed protein product [Paramecium sonneborni]